MSPAPLDESRTLTYARVVVGTQRYSRAELAEMREGVRLLFGEPSQAALESLIRAVERIQGRPVTRHVHGYLIRCWRIHGPETERMLMDLYRERGTDQNLLLAVELAPPAWLDAEETGESPRPSDGADRGDRRNHAAHDDVYDASGQDDIPLFDAEPPWPDEHQRPAAGAGTQTDTDAWHCRVGPDHVPQARPDGSRYCATCHP